MLVKLEPLIGHGLGAVAPRQWLRLRWGGRPAWTRLVRASLEPILTRWLGTSCEPDPGTATLSGERTTSDVDSYRYLLRTAPPRAIERGHREALRQLTLAQRRQLFRRLAQQLRDAEPSHEPELGARALARLATRVALCQPALLERALGADASGPVEPDSLLGALARAFTATPIAQQYLGEVDHDGVVTDPAIDAGLGPEHDYEDLDYETPPLECFVDRMNSVL